MTELGDARESYVAVDGKPLLRARARPAVLRGPFSCRRRRWHEGPAYVITTFSKHDPDSRAPSLTSTGDVTRCHRLAHGAGAS